MLHIAAVAILIPNVTHHFYITLSHGLWFFCVPSCITATTLCGTKLMYYSVLFYVKVKGYGLRKERLFHSSCRVWDFGFSFERASAILCTI